MDRTTRRRFWLSHVTVWRESGLSQSAYCREHGLAPSTFHYWKRQADKPERWQDDVAPSLSLVAVSLPPTRSTEPMRLRWDGGPIVELGIGFSHSALCEVIRAVRDAHDSR